MLRLGVSVLGLSFLLLGGCTKTTVNPGGTLRCTSASDCPSNLPMCHPDSKICVGCIDSFNTCPEKTTCQSSTHTCVPLAPDAPCKRNPDCPRPGYDPAGAVTCEVDAGVCVQCVRNTDCVMPDVCVPGLSKCGDFCEACSPAQICDKPNARCLNSDGGAGDL